MKQHSPLRRLSFVMAMVAVGLMALSQLSAGAKGPSADQRERNAAKARDLYVEAMQYMAMDDPDACATLIRRAYALNPDDNDIKYEHGLMLAVTSAYMGGSKAREGVELMQQAILAEPANTDRGLRFMNVVSKLPGVEFSADDLLAILSRLYSAADDRSLIASTYAAMLRSSNNIDSVRKSIAILDSLEYVEGISQEVSTAKAQAYANIGDTVASLAEVRKLYAAHPDNPDYLMILGVTNDLFGYTDSAFARFDQGIERFPDLPDFHMRKAVSCAEKNDTAGVITVLTNAMAVPELEFGIKQQMLQYFAQALFTGHYGMLLDPMKSLVAAYPDEYDALLDYAIIAAEAGDTATALTQYKVARQLDPANMRGYSMAAHLYDESGDFDKAIAMVRKGIVKSDSPDPLRQYLIYLHVIHDRYAEALPYVTEFINDLSRGFDIDAALAERVIIEADTMDVVIDPELLGGDDEDEFAVAVDSIEGIDNPVDTLQLLGELYLQRADIYMKLDKMKKAIPDYEIALRVMPDNWLPYNNYAYMLADRNTQLDRALELAEKSMKLVNDASDGEQHFTSIGDTYAWVLYRRGELLKAKELIDQVLDLDPELSAEVLDHAGDIYSALGLKDEAVGFWTEALTKDPDDPEAITAKIKRNAPATPNE
ncbi:MAG: tetratricopeptide repeat protein [Paramuribaculum sp.]|nr:tetratricopeptide repeat protein [Paramuribaculum sp.]